MHAFPHNAQAELMDGTMFQAGVNSSIRAAAEMGSPHRPRVLSQRDVVPTDHPTPPHPTQPSSRRLAVRQPGLTRAVIPHLKRRGVIGISVSPTAICRWAASLRQTSAQGGGNDILRLWVLRSRSGGLQRRLPRAADALHRAMRCPRPAARAYAFPLGR